jgi:hypothetical protein
VPIVYSNDELQLPDPTVIQRPHLVGYLIYPCAWALKMLEKVSGMLRLDGIPGPYQKCLYNLECEDQALARIETPIALSTNV